MPIDPAALARSVSALITLDAERDLARAIQRVTSVAAVLFGSDGAGLMLVDERGALRWASASDQRAQALEEGQERLGEGPCVAAFQRQAPIAVRDVRLQHWGELNRVAAGQEVRAALSVPVRLEGGPVGTLDLYSTHPRDWGDEVIGGLEAYATLVAVLLSLGVSSLRQSQLAEQLQVALDRRILIEQAKGMVMAREGLGEVAAFERLRTTARSSRRTITEVAAQVLAGESLPPPSQPPTPTPTPAPDPNPAGG
jgi:GAF domain-containing protein